MRKISIHPLEVSISKHRADPNDGFKDNKVHFGQQIRIRLNPLLIDKPIYLYS
jgi:hypothetical protein